MSFNMTITAMVQQKVSIKVTILCMLLCLLLLGAACTPLEQVPSRQMGVSLGPSSVFNRPVAQILPQLESAAATGLNGRVGNEMVFWGYRLQNDTNANLFACALVDGVDCETRIDAVCPAGGEELARVTAPGMVRHMQCRAVGFAAPGELRPNCDDDLESNDLLVGLMQCR